MNQFLSIIVFNIGRVFALFYPQNVNQVLNKLKYSFYSGWLWHNFKHCGHTSRFYPPHFSVHGGAYISIGEHVHIGMEGHLSAFNKSGMPKDRTIIRINDGCVFGPYCHITAASGVYIGKNLRTGSKILISDNSHGDPKDVSLLDLHPDDRPIFSKGPIYIGDNVWLGDNCSILGGVKIGNGVIVGANTVVTHDIPDYCIAVGAPARIITRDTH